MDILDKYYLKNWWLEALTPSQREQIANDYQPMGLISNPPFLYQPLSNNGHSGMGICGLIHVLACVAKGQAKDILLTKTESVTIAEYSNPKTNLIDVHLVLGSLIKHHYALREKLDHYERAKELCLMQIAIADKTANKFRHPEKPKELKRLHQLTGMKHPYYDEPQMLPSHTGYKQLAIILEKEGDLEGALKISKQALKQGWTDNYEKRIDKLNHKLAKKKIAKVRTTPNS